MSSGRRSIYSTSNSTRDSLGSDVMVTSSNNKGIRTTSNVKICESCCSSDLCNNAGCGAKGRSRTFVRKVKVMMFINAKITPKVYLKQTLPRGSLCLQTDHLITG